MEAPKPKPRSRPLLALAVAATLIAAYVAGSLAAGGSCQDAHGPDGCRTAVAAR